ncbi:hypothetical protein LCGC14_0717000 [marine sediment metagenome]|uniref:Uncharacterized protein n=1 Tax=marine sediment metagenome TaxID=412755 RepID=A0A0F9QYK6_9ZZZZ|nr:hypothetical protein [bacterium]
MAFDASTEINLDSENVVEFTVSVGDTIKLCPPPSYPPMGFTNKDTTQYLKGFLILRPDLGKFTGLLGACVKYKHEKSGKQIIQFASRGLGEKYFYAIVAGITVHDHASIAQGGPAFATYFSDVPAEQTEEGD